MRRTAVSLTLLAALALATSAHGTPIPIDRHVGELSLPRVRAGTITIPKGHAAARTRVIVTLRLPPLAARFGRTLAGTASSRRLQVSTAASRVYLAQVARAQNAAVASLRRAIPEARVDGRFRIVLDGLTVDLPVKKLPALARQSFAAHVYPSLRYTLNLNRSPSLIGVDAIEAATGARGDGVKIGVVDDGIDSGNRFFNPKGYSYPAGFPKGAKKWTTPKVIVARAFPGPGSDRPGRLALDRRASFHGTHVAGIAAGDEGTTAPRGPDHPRTGGLSGVAPRAYLGNYRVFTVPTPIGHVANTPEIVAAFESAVSDGMDVINFSGGGAESEPANDALIEAVANVSAAGVVPVIAAGNDRDDFGLGSAGSPGTAPDAISVAAVSNSQVFSPSLSVVRAPGAPDSVRRIPIQSGDTPPAWSTIDQKLVDVGTLLGRGGAPVDRRLCGIGKNPNTGTSPLRRGSLRGAIALASRGHCSFFSKAQRAKAAGARGLILVDNRAGEANGIPLRLPVPSGMISDLDGARMRAYLAGTSGVAFIRVSADPQRIQTGRGGTLTSFSSAGPTSFSHRLKPDVSAPGGQILSSTLREFARSPFAVFDGTSMATPHVAGAAALLVQRHPQWTPQQVKSALISTAGPAYADTGRTVEAPVVLGGGGLVNLPVADNPLVFTSPASLSFDDLNLNRGARSSAMLVSLADAGGGAGTWTVELRPQAASTGATLDLPTSVTLAPGAQSELPIVVRADARAAAGENYGFIVLSRGDATRRIPYLFTLTRPGLEFAPRIKLKAFQTGQTRKGVSRASVYCCPSEPFGPPPDYTGPAMNENGAERLYVTRLDRPAANMGVAVIASTPGSQIDPFLLGSPNERDVQGYAGTPVDVNELTFDFKLDVGAAAAVFPRQGTYYVAVDSGRDQFTRRSLPGRYLLRSWVDDVQPPFVQLLTRRVAAGRPLLIARVVDFGAGVDPYSLVLAYGRDVLVGAAAYDPASALAFFPLPRTAPKLVTGKRRAITVASDFQEAKNVNTSGMDIMPNTTYAPVRLTVVSGPAVSWIAPDTGECVAARTRLVVAGSSTAGLRRVRFLDGRSQIGVDRRSDSGIFAVDWRTKRAKKGRHTLTAVLQDARGRRASVQRTVRVCR